METFTVEVEGGALQAARAGSGPVVLAAHGITANHRSWQAVADELSRDFTFVAVDLRGRGRSSGLPGPYGMGAHARDLVAVLDHLDAEDAVLLGHSMGAFVAVVTGARHPERVRSLVLVDGGLPLPVPEGLSIDDVLAAVIGPAMQRLSMTFESREAHLDFWRAHPALGPYWDEGVEAYVDYDLVGDAPSMRSSVSIDAVRSDATDMLTTDVLASSLDALEPPAFLLRAERGMLDNPEPLVPDALAQAWPKVVDLGVVGDTNHYTIAFAPHGVKAIAEAVRSAR